MAYVGFYLAIRSGDWDLRMACRKKMAAVFTAFDHLQFQRLISPQLADMLYMSLAILTTPRHGTLVVSISGNSWHSVGTDEAHELNKRALLLDTTFLVKGKEFSSNKDFK